VAKFKGDVSRDEWMAKTITKIFQTSPNSKMFVIIGNNHILKNLEWLDHVPTENKSIREYLLDFNPDLKIFSIGQVIGESVFEDDFRKRFSSVDGAVALDLDERFKGWKSCIVENIALKDAEVWELLDGLVVY
jgi:hypothetical protein